MNRELLIDRVVKHYIERKLWREDCGEFSLTVNPEGVQSKLIAEIPVGNGPIRELVVIARVLPRSWWSKEKLRLHVEKMIRRCEVKVAMHAVSELQ